MFMCTCARALAREAELNAEHVLQYVLKFIEDVHSGMKVDCITARDTIMLWLQQGSANRYPL